MSTKYLNHAQAHQRFFKNSEVRYEHSSDGVKLSISVGHDSNIHLFMTVPKVWANPRYLGFFEEFPEENRLVSDLRNKVAYELRAESRGKKISLGNDKELILRLIDPLLNGLVEKLRLAEKRREEENKGTKTSFITKTQFDTSSPSSTNKFPSAGIFGGRTSGRLSDDEGNGYNRHSRGLYSRSRW